MKRAVLSLTFAAALFALGSAANGQTQASGGGPTVTVYALDEYGEDALIRPARPVAGYEDWLTVADLPPEAFDPERYKYLRISLAIAADDSVTDCQPVRDAPADLAALACKTIRARGRFVHALDASGKAQSSTHVMSIVLQVLKPGDWAGLPPAPPPPGWRDTKPVIRDLKLRLLPADRKLFLEPAPSLWADINAKGRVTRCRIRFSTGSDAGDVELCRRMAKAKFDPARDPGGNKVPTKAFYVTFAVAQ